MSYKKYLKQLLFILFFLGSGLSLVAQLPVKISNNKVSIGGTAYYIHIVDSAQTLYSISKAYNVSSEIITRENPEALFGLRTGQALKIPVIVSQTPSIKERDTKNFIYHQLQKGETIYSLSKRYDVPEEQIIDSNPEMDIFDISVGTELAIPRKEFLRQPQSFNTGEQTFILHKVEKGETLYSIGRKYNVSVKILRDANDKLRFPKEDSYVRVPTVEVNQVGIEQQVEEIEDTLILDDDKLTFLFDGTPVSYTPIENLSGKVSVAIMLPLYLKENSKRSYIDSSEINQYNKKVYKQIKRPETWIYPRSEYFIEFYEGALLAIESLRNKGLSIELNVFDTAADSSIVANILRSGQLGDVDIIIGPVYSNNVDQVAAYAKSHRIPVVSPLAAMNSDILNNNPYLFKIQPSVEIIQTALASTISSYYDHNIIFVHSDTAYNREGVSDFRNKIFRQLQYKVPFDEIRIKEVFFRSRSNFNDTINIIEHAMAKDRPNLVVVASDNESVMSDVLINVYTLLRKYNIKVIGYPDLMWLNNLDPEYFYRLGLMLYTQNWVDYTQADVREFLKRYRSMFNTEPPLRSYAWQAYDITYFFLSGLAVQGDDFKYRPAQHHPDLLQVDYDFRRAGLRDGFENTKLYLIRYRPDLSIEFIRE